MRSPSEISPPGVSPSALFRLEPLGGLSIMLKSIGDKLKPGYLQGVNRGGTYRVQLRPGFGFDEASALAEYWQALGVSHIYCSPYLQATDGSTHGYDVVDHSKVNEELGGNARRAAFCETLRRYGLRQLLDIVPNHMAIRGGHNVWWWDVLENGPSSRFSRHFDVEWRASEFERVVLPILGDQYGVELEAGRLVVERRRGALLIRYFEHENPVAPRSLGQFLRPVARRLEHPQLGFVADCLAELPAPNATDRDSRKRRHRDKEVLLDMLEALCLDPTVAEAIDLQVARTNSSPDALHELLQAQNYRLAFWRIGNQELDYRRFFDIDSLVGLCVEDEEVFEATHSLVITWLVEGSIDGVRVDHIDGLYDPRGYLERLRQRAPSAWLLVEKILEDGEELPPWPVSGTTGYEFLNVAQRVLTHPDGEAPLDALADELLREPQDYVAMVESAKRLVLREALGSDLHRLVNRLADIVYDHRRVRDYSRRELGELLAELCVEFPVYRTYVHPDHPVGSNDTSVVHETCKRLRAKHPRFDPRLVDFLERLLLLEWRDAEEVEFVLRLQQLTGPVMAKGVEDTTFYRFVRLTALNEVGGDPSAFHVDIHDFHAAMQRRQACYPEALNATSTHDTKRSEDVRARLLCLSEVPMQWADNVRQWRELAGVGPDCAVDPAMEYLLWQTLVGAWPIDSPRLSEYARKAAREAKIHTSWHSPNAEYEGALDAHVSALLGNAELVARIEAFVGSLTPGFEANALAQTLLKLACPGVPDVYQGTELWDLSLVDPDNRRPVEYAARKQLLAELPELTAEQIWERRRTGIAKLWLLNHGLKVRRALPECFGAQGTYQPILAHGQHSARVLAFARGQDALAVATRWWLRFGSDFPGTTLVLPPGDWLNRFTQCMHGGEVGLPTLLGPFPCALLTRVDEAPS